MSGQFSVVIISTALLWHVAVAFGKLVYYHIDLFKYGIAQRQLDTRTRVAAWKITGAPEFFMLDQLEADDDLSLKQRLALAGGSAVEGVGDVTGIDAVNIAGGVIKDQATADEDASLKERLAIGVGSAAGGIKDSSDDPLVHGLAKAVEKGAGEVADHYGDETSSSSSD